MNDILPKLRTNIKNGKSAPHKPILLLAVLKAYDKGLLKSDIIPLTPELLALFKQIWGYLVVTNHNPNISYPFYHLTGDKFWRLVPKSGFEDLRLHESKFKSLCRLDEAIEYAMIEKKIAHLMLNPTSRADMVEALLKEYFPATRSRYDAESVPNDSLGELAVHLRDTSPDQYRQETELLLKKKDDESIFQRGAAFRRYVPQYYKYTCAITRWHLTASTAFHLLEACHIIPFCESHDDTFSNGIALSPTIHRAFDRGLISISDDYKVIVKSGIQESDGDYSLKKLDGRPILLPEDHRCHPGIPNLRSHRQRWEF